MASYKWERRASKREARRSRIPKHGKNIAMVYRNAVLKRLKGVLVKHCPECKREGNLVEMVPNGGCETCRECGYSPCHVG